MCIKKEMTINIIQKVFSNSNMLALYQDSGMSTSEYQNLQTVLKQNGLRSLHLKNKISKVALKDSIYRNFSILFEGPCVLIYSESEKAKPIHVYSLYSEFPKLLPIGGLFLNSYISSKQFKWASSIDNLHQFHWYIASYLSNISIELISNMSSLPIDINHIITQKSK